MPNTNLAERVAPTLKKIGYRDECLSKRAKVGAAFEVPLVAYSGLPLDARTACIGIVGVIDASQPQINACREIGAPIIFSPTSNGDTTIWKQKESGPEELCRIKHDSLPLWIKDHKSALEPKAIYRAKVWGAIEPIQPEQQELLIDAQFLPTIEDNSGELLSEFLSELIHELRARLKWKTPRGERAEWLLKAPFWLLAAKILQDKRVPTFIQLDLEDIEQVFDRLARHYDSANPLPITNFQNRYDALRRCAVKVKNYAYLGNISTEALGHVFEHTLVTKETRKELGTHRTPSWLIDYVIGRMRPWISNQSSNDRRIFEPGCGHAGFLLAGLRLLDELRPLNHKEPRHKYLRDRLKGIEIDPFAEEIARLTLTLGDVPNPNGWKLKSGNMFEGEELVKSIRGSTIIFANPPYEKFSDKHKPDQLYMKAEELLRQIVKHLPLQGCFGLVLPQRVLHSEQLTKTRKLLLDEFEVDEATLFADKVFNAGETESVVLIARRKAPTDQSKVRFQRVRESQVPIFAKTSAPSSSVFKSQNTFRVREAYKLIVPELEQLWDYLSDNATLGGCCLVGKGFEHLPVDSLPKGTIRISGQPSGGLEPGFAKWETGQLTHKLPLCVGLNIDRKVIRPKSSLHGIKTGIPQVLINHGCVSRCLWRINALKDPLGHAVKGRFLVIRPKTQISLEAIWAVCNSPVANARIATLSGKRDVLASHVREIPLPENPNWQEVENAVEQYFEAAAKLDELKELHQKQMSEPLLRTNLDKIPTVAYIQQHEENLKWCHWRVDCAVLRQYKLPEELEGQLLRYFTTTTGVDAKRRGVAFLQDSYFPEHFTQLNRLNDLLKITADWDKTNDHRIKLIDRKIKETISSSQVRELATLKKLARANSNLVMPFQMDELKRQESLLREQGKWEGV